VEIEASAGADLDPVEIGHAERGDPMHERQRNDAAAHFVGLNLIAEFDVDLGSMTLHDVFEIAEWNR